MSAADTHHRLVAVSADAAPNHKTVLRWVESFSTGHESVKKWNSLSHLSTAQSSALQHVFHIMENGTKPLMNCNWQHLCHAIIHKELRMKKVCAHWVPRDLTPRKKKREQSVQNCQELLAFHKDQEGFFARLITGDGPWFHWQIQR